MTSYQKTIVDTSDWIVGKKIDDLNLMMCLFEHEIIERVFVNVAASYSVKCRDIMSAQRTDGPYFAYLCICIILIDEYLFKVLSIKEHDRKILLEEWYYVLADYYDSK